MRASDIERYSANMTDGGLRRLAAEGVVCRNASYDYRSTTTPVSLATLSTGAQPCVHGVIGDSWYDYADNSIVGLIDDDKEQSVKYSTGSGSYSPRRLIAPTLGDALAAENEHSKIVTIAVDPSRLLFWPANRGGVLGGDRTDALDHVELLRRQTAGMARTIQLAGYEQLLRAVALEHAFTTSTNTSTRRCRSSRGIQHLVEAGASGRRSRPQTRSHAHRPHAIYAGGQYHALGAGHQHDNGRQNGTGRRSRYSEYMSGHVAIHSRDLRTRVGRVRRHALPPGQGPGRVPAFRRGAVRRPLAAADNLYGRTRHLALVQPSPASSRPNGSTTGRCRSLSTPFWERATAATTT